MKNNFIPIIKIRGENLPLMSQTKFLGVIIDDSLRFSDHINLVCNKISRSIGVIKKVSDYLPQTALRSLYYTLVYPHVIYAIEVWGSSSQTQLNRLRRLLDKCLKIICEATRNDNRVDIRFLNFDQIYKYFCLIRIFKYYTMNLGPYFKDKFEVSSTEHQYNTRFSLNRNLLHPNVRSSKVFNSFFYNSIRFWNTIPVSAKRLDSVSQFKKYLKSCVFEVC